MIFTKIKELLAGKRFITSDEKKLQDQLAFEFSMCVGLPVMSREHFLGKTGRVDFFANGTAIEVKTKGGPRAIYMQLLDYAKHEDVKEIILITAKTMTLPATINGKPANFIQLSNAWL